MEKDKRCNWSILDFVNLYTKLNTEHGESVHEREHGVFEHGISAIHALLTVI